MPFDAAVFAALAKELKETLAEARCDRVGAAGPAEVSLALRAGSQDLLLVLSIDGPLARLHLASAGGPAAKQAARAGSPSGVPPFVLLLRKHLPSCRIETVTQAPWERQLSFHLHGPSDEFPRRRYTLVYELLGTQANLLLVDGQGLLLGTLRPPAGGDASHARLVVGAAYVAPAPAAPPPPAASLTYLTQALGLAAPDTPLRAALQRNVAGLGPWASRVIAQRAGLAPETACRNLVPEDLAHLEQELGAFGSAVMAGCFAPTLHREAGRPHDFWAFPGSALPGLAAEPVSSVNEAILRVYGDKVVAARLERARHSVLHRLEAELGRVTRRQAAQRQDLARAEEAGALRQSGDVILANLGRLTRGATSFTGQSYGGTEQVKVQLDPRLSPQENAQRYFARYRKAKRGQMEAAQRLAETTAALEELRLLRLEALDATTVHELEELAAELAPTERPAATSKRKATTRPRHPATPPAPSGRTYAPRRYWSSEGLEILVGRNSRENDRLTLHSGSPWDIWLHVKDLPGAHVILRLPSEAPPPDASLLEAALLAAYHSDGRDSTRVSVDYAMRRHVRKTPGGGPGQVLYDHHRTALVTPDPAMVAKLKVPPAAPSRREGTEE